MLGRLHHTVIPLFFVFYLNHVSVQYIVCDFSAFCCTLPFVCTSVLTSDVWNDKINIELLNILVHSRSKVEVFFWQTLPASTTPLHTNPTSLFLLTNALCAPGQAQSITRRLAGEKALSQGGCFLVLPALLFQRAPGRPRWWTLWSSLAGSFGTLSLFNLTSSPPLLSPPQPVPLTSCFHKHLSLCPSSVVHSLFDNDDYCTCLNSPFAKWPWPSETSLAVFVGASQGAGRL